MSYEPTLIILKKDLDKHKDFLLDGEWQYIESKSKKGVEEKRILEYIRDTYTSTSVTVGGIELLICQPELSSFNKLIRKRLQDLDVEFGLHN